MAVKPCGKEAWREESEEVRWQRERLGFLWAYLQTAAAAMAAMMKHVECQG